MNKLLTIVFNSYYSKKNLYRVLKSLKKYPIIIIENSLDADLKSELEKKYKNVKVVIPKENLGLAKGYNLGIKKAKTSYVFLNNPDIEISSKSIDILLLSAQKIIKFGILAPTYDNERIFKNYSNYNVPFNNGIPFLKKSKIYDVNWIDNNFLVNRKEIAGDLFDENYFLYFETIDFCLNLKRKKNKLLVFKNIKFKHFGAKSTDRKYKNVVSLTRAWHYNWSKFYYYKKNYNYFYALKKIFPNLIQAIKKIIINIFKLNSFSIYLSVIEIYGIISAILCLKSFYRPNARN